MRNRGGKLLALTAVFGSAGLVVFGFFFFTALVLEPNWITVERVVIEDEKLAKPLAGMTIAQISDLHLEGGLGFREKELVRKLNRLSPDIILITGDLVEAAAPQLVEELVKGLRPRIWSYGILGNSDRIYLPAEGYRERWRRAGLSLVGGRCLPMAGKRGEIFYLGGIDFPGYEVPGVEEEIDRVLEDLPAGAPLIFLSYDPDLAPLLIEKGADLVLSGDTHGGLIGIPGWGKVFHRVFGRSEYIRGFYSIGGGILYVNRGIAPKVVPARFLCPPEITVFEFRYSG
jgi:uncharacterized protein